MAARSGRKSPLETDLTNPDSNTFMPPPPIGGGIKRCFCLTSDVCLSRTSGPSREQRPRKTKIGTEVAHVTRDSDTTFKVKRSKVKATRPLCSPPCWRVRRTAAVGVGTCWPWDTAAIRCRLLGGAKRFGAHGGGEGRGHTVHGGWRLPAYSLRQIYACTRLCRACGPPTPGTRGPERAKKKFQRETAS